MNVGDSYTIIVREVLGDQGEVIVRDGRRLMIRAVKENSDGSYAHECQYLGVFLDFEE